jgi:hypothetical protein
MPKVQAPNQQYLDSLKSLDLPNVQDTPPVDPIVTSDKPIHNQVEIEPQAVSDQFRSSPNMVEESSKAESFPERKLESFLLESQLINFFDIPKESKVISKNIKLHEYVEMALKDYCHKLYKHTGNKPKEKNVIGNAIIEYIKNNPID